MVGSGLKKMAASHQMSITDGVAYGSMNGYATTLSEGNGFKLVQFTTLFPDKQKQFELQTMLNGHNLQKEYRIQKLEFSPNRIVILFHDNPGTMKKIQAFLDWFMPFLEEYGATKANICTECGCEIMEGCWNLIDGTAYHMHSACAGSVKREIEEQQETKRREDGGSYATGFLGALIGALLGAVLWAVVYSFGYIAGIVGFVIGWLAEKGYNLLHGKQGKGKIAILIVVVIIGVFVGNVGGDMLDLAIAIGNGELPGLTYGDIPWIYSLVLEDSSYISGMMGNMVMGLIFAGLGIFSLIRRAGKEVSGVKIKNLK